MPLIRSYDCPGDVLYLQSVDIGDANDENLVMKNGEIGWLAHHSDYFPTWVPLLLHRMPSVYELKPAFQNALRPTVAVLANAGVTANQVTLAACLLSVGAGYRASEEPRVWWILPVVLFVRMALNAIDGMLAREHAQQTPLGAMLNELTDVISDAALLYPFLFLDPWWMAATISLAALTELAGLSCVLATGQRRYDGPFGKSDRALAFGTLAAVYALGWDLRPELEQAIPKLAAFLCAVTVVNRVRCALS